MNSHHDFFCTAFALWVYVPSLMMGPRSGVWNPFLLSGLGRDADKADSNRSPIRLVTIVPSSHTWWLAGRGVVSEFQLVSVDVFNRKPVLLGILLYLLRFIASA